MNNTTKQVNVLNYLQEESNYNRTLANIINALKITENKAIELLHELYLVSDDLTKEYTTSKSGIITFLVLKARRLLLEQRKIERRRRKIEEEKLPYYLSSFYLDDCVESIDSQIEQILLNLLEREIFGLLFDDMKKVKEIVQILQVKYDMAQSTAYAHIKSLKDKVVKAVEK